MARAHFHGSECWNQSGTDRYSSVLTCRILFGFFIVEIRAPRSRSTLLLRRSVQPSVPCKKQDSGLPDRSRMINRVGDTAIPHRRYNPMEGSSGSGKHFILVHGLCHGAWCWYKVVPMLRAAGHRVTALDLASSGAHPARLDEVPSFEDYSRPLLDAVAGAGESERLVLVGHSLGGLSVALAMERFPRKVAVAVFLTAGMPCAGTHLGLTLDEFLRRIKPDFFMDSERMVLNTDHGPRAAVVLGPKLLAAKLYDRSSAEDLSLATMLMRVGSQFVDDPIMKDETVLTEANYGSVKKVFVVVKADACMSEELQRWMVDLSPGTEAEEIAGSDHMAMCSRPRELCDVLLRIATKYG